MRLFMSWSGKRSRAVGHALQDWLPVVLPGLEIFHSEEIPKGANWHTELIRALRGCSLGVFCVTPENVHSSWLLFEAGALAQQGDEPTLMTYTLVPMDLDGPLGHFQATRFDRDDTKRFVRALGKRTGADETGATARFDDTWDTFASRVSETARIEIEELIPGFFANFDRRNTFEEPFPDCTDKRWDDRLRRTASVRAILENVDSDRLMAGSAEAAATYAALLKGLKVYDMHIGALLLEPREYDGLPAEDRDRLENARKSVLKAVDQLRAPASSV